MISILIPTYSFNAFPLVKELHNQLKTENISFEIICFDDASNSDQNKFNYQINQLSNSFFKELNKNLGRSRIRNLLVSESKYDWLLFLDSDVIPVKKDFIKKYIYHINKTEQVFCGGIKYKKDTINSNLLRWKYGNKNEEVSLAKRINAPNGYFFTSNFLCSKTVFNKVKFNDEILEYGCEDLLFGLNLKNNNIKINHIENLVYHLGIDSNERFINKIKKSITNLNWLVKNNKIKYNQTVLLRIVHIIKKIGLISFVGNLYPRFEKKAISSSSVFLFNLFRISYLSSLNS